MVSSSESSVRPKPSFLLASNLNSAPTYEPTFSSVTAAEPPRTYQPREKEICRFYLRGICKNGDACRFRHCAQTQVQVFLVFLMFMLNIVNTKQFIFGAVSLQFELTLVNNTTMALFAGKFFAHSQEIDELR